MENNQAGHQHEIKTKTFVFQASKQENWLEEQWMFEKSLERQFVIVPNGMSDPENGVSGRKNKKKTNTHLLSAISEKKNCSMGC